MLVRVQKSCCVLFWTSWYQQQLEPVQERNIPAYPVECVPMPNDWTRYARFAQERVFSAGAVATSLFITVAGKFVYMEARPNTDEILTRSRGSTRRPCGVTVHNLGG